MIFELSPNLRKKLRENKINHINKKFRNGLDFILNRRTRGNHRAKGKEGSTKAMKHLLSLIEKSVANDKWTKFVEILEKKGTYCIQ